MKPERLWLALRFPHWVWQAQGFSLENEQQALVAEKHKILWASPKALSLGVCLGMATSHAEALIHCPAVGRNIQQEQLQLKKLAEIAYQLTPHIQPYQCPATAQAGLWLEVSSCLRLFGGINAFINRLHSVFTPTAMQYEIGQAQSGYGAWLLSFLACPISADMRPAVFNQRLHTVPIEWLGAYPKAVDMLVKSGFKTLGDILAQLKTQSISSFRKRLGAEFALMLSELFAIEHNLQQSALFTAPLNYYQPEEIFQQQLQFDYPISNSDLLHTPIEHLLKQLEVYLRQRQLQTHSINWRLGDIYQRNIELKVYADQPQSTRALLYELTLIQLEAQQLAFEVDNLRLSCHHTVAAQKYTAGLNFTAAKPQHSPQGFTLTAAKLKARLGDDALVKLSYQDSYLPEESNQTIALNKKSTQVLPDCHFQALRPSWLLNPPEIINSRRGLFWHGRLILLAGPERVHGLWWHTPTARDYFLAQRQDCIRLWVFCDLHTQQWFVQGVFG